MKHEDVCVVLEFVGNLFVDPVPSDTGAQKNFPKGVCILQGGGGGDIVALVCGSIQSKNEA